MFENVSRNDVIEAWNYWYPLVYGYFYRRVNNQTDVEDLTANTLNAFFMKAEVRNDKGFIWQTAKNQLYKYIESKKLIPDMINLNENLDVQKQTYAYFEEHIETKYSSHYSQKIKQLLDCCKKQLSKQDYGIVFSSIIDNQNSSEIGKYLNINPATIRQKLKRSITKLKKGCTTLWIELKPNKYKQE
ncbi:MAG: sigma-70 family RNA polymerase sigma factor [Patescibacteria group bacterium]